MVCGGGAVANTHDCTIDNSTFASNYVVGNHSSASFPVPLGGAILQPNRIDQIDQNPITLAINRTTFTANSVATAPASSIPGGEGYGGAIYAASGTVTVAANQCTFDQNTAGGKFGPDIYRNASVGVTFTACHGDVVKMSDCCTLPAC
jgi:hypothetical protein